MSGILFLFPTSYISKICCRRFLNKADIKVFQNQFKCISFQTYLLLWPTSDRYADQFWTQGHHPALACAGYSRWILMSSVSSVPVGPRSTNATDHWVWIRRKYVTITQRDNSHRYRGDPDSKEIFYHQPFSKPTQWSAGVDCNILVTF